MSDSQLRELERAVLEGAPGAADRLRLWLERAGILESLQSSIETLLERVQPDPPEARIPTSSKLGVTAIAKELREIVDSARPAARLLIADHHFRSPTAAPEGTYAAIAVDGNSVVLGIDRGDTRKAAGFKASLGKQRDPLAVLGVLSLTAKNNLLRMTRTVGREWSRWYRNKGRWSYIEHVRLRPAMYVGTTELRGVCTLVDHLLDSALELFAERRCSSVRARLFPSGACSIADDGPGISAETDEGTGLPLLEVAFTHTVPTHFRWARGYRVSGGLHGVGPAVVSALSLWFEVESHHQGRILFQRYERGVPLAPPELRGRTDREGLTVTFLPDPTIFKPPVAIPGEWLRQRLRELAFLNKGLSLSFEVVGDQPRQESYHSRAGVLEGLAAKLGAKKGLLAAPIVIEGSASSATGEPPVFVEIALTWTRRSGASIETYVNSVAMTEGGTHVDAIRDAIRETMHAFARKQRRRHRKNRSFCEGLVAFGSLRVPYPAFQGCLRSKLANSEVAPIVKALVSEAIEAFAKGHPDELLHTVMT